MTTPVNGTIPGAETPPEPRAYTMMASMTPEEKATIYAAGSDPADYAIALCPAAMPIQLAQPVQIVQLLDMATQEPTGETGVIALVPVIVPLEIPTLASGILGPGGVPASTIQMEGPSGALCRLVVPRTSLTPAATTELVEHERQEQMMAVLRQVAVNGVDDHPLDNGD